MVFIVKKKIKGSDYYYLRESKRINGKVKAVTVTYLGKFKNRKDAENKFALLKNEKDFKGKNESNLMTDNKKIISDSTNQSRVNAEDIVGVASNRGFFFQTANIYGGKASFYTYGHLGKMMKNNWESLWKKYFLDEENFFEIQSNNILPEKVFVASGHLEHFKDKFIECDKCKSRFRKEDVSDKMVCLKCNSALSDSGSEEMMMFPVSVGSDKDKSYLSPETAQAAYIAFKQEFEATRRKLPLGLAIIDKAFRNEISPRQLFFRLREFTQAELQQFFDPDEINILDEKKWSLIKDYHLRLKLVNNPGDAISLVSCSEANDKIKIPKMYLYALAKIQKFYIEVLGIPENKFRFFEVPDNERAFYNRIHFDVEIYLSTLNGFKEVAGVHYRGDHDLKGHQKVSGEKHEVFFNNKRILPHVLEWSFGVDRNLWALFDVFSRQDKNKSDTIIFNFPKRLAPFQASILPLVNKGGIDSLAKEVYSELKSFFSCFYDSSGSIGRRYARQDEIGTPFCITVDGDSLTNHDVTIRDRDSSKQIRVKISELNEVINNLLDNKISFVSSGRLVKE